MTWQDKIRDPDCQLCPLHEGADHVCLMGSGSRKSKIMIIGEAPGEREDEAHRAFVGPAGALLTELLEAAGISRDDCYITNVAKCRPDSNRTPELSEIKTCVSTYLSAELERVQPTHILLLGNSALRGVAGRSGITKHRGTTFQVGDAEALATFHPAYILRSPFHKPTLVADVERFARMTRGQNPSLEKTRVKIIRHRPQLKWLIARLMEADVISYDIETWVPGVNSSKKKDRNKLGQEWRKGSVIVSIAFSWKIGEACVVPLHHESTPWADPDAVLRRLKPCLERTDARYVAHNGLFDCRWLASSGIFVKQTFDTMLAAHQLDENRLKGLKPLSQTLLGADAWDVGVEVGNAYNENLRKLCIYNGYDTDYTLRLYHRFKAEMLEPDNARLARVFAKLMMPASNALVPVEVGGVWIDPVRYKERLRKMERRRDKVEVELRKSCGDINLKSPQQVAKWLFSPKGKKVTVGTKRNSCVVRGLGLPIIEETGTGAPSTNERVILRLAKKNPELRLLLKYRTYQMKYIGTYFAQWREVDENSRFHPGYKLFGTVTGRLSGDFQQVPRDPFMRSIIGAPAGWTFVEADYSQVELRIAAWLANERRMLRIFAMGEDAHLNTAVQITGKRPQDISVEERKHGKSVNFGFLYSMGWKKFIEYAFQHYEIDITEAESQEYHRRFHETYPSLRVWHDRQRRLVRRYQRVHSPIGRVRHLPTVLSSDQSVRAEAERQAINSPVQSFASDLMLLSLVRLHGILPMSEARIVGTVHDSILFEVRTGLVEKWVPVIHKTMVDLEDIKRKFACEIPVPIEVEVKVGQHWGEGEKWNLK